MQVLEEFPPNYEKIAARFDLTGRKPLFCYGDTIYNPHKAEITPDQIIHESVHIKQQGDPEEWWNRYLTDDAFRFSQELEAYAVQYGFVKKNTDKKTTKNCLNILADLLSSPMYGGLCTAKQAKEKIKQTYYGIMSQ